MKRIEAVFTAAKLDPHDVKVLFDPVEYIVFDGMSRGKVQRVLLLSTEGGASKGRAPHESIANVPTRRAVSFRTLRVSKEGGCSMA